MLLSLLTLLRLYSYFFFFFNDTATTEIYTLSLHDALPICGQPRGNATLRRLPAAERPPGDAVQYSRRGRTPGEASLKQLEDELANDQTTLTRSLTLLECDGVLERASHPDQLPVGSV